MPKKLTPEEAIASAEIDRQIIAMRRDNMHFADIAVVVGLAQSTCHDRFQRWVDKGTVAEASMWKAEELDLLGRGIRNVLAIAENDSCSPNQRVLAQTEIRLHSESRRGITGINAPTKREFELVDTSQADAQLAREMREMENEIAAANANRGDTHE